MATFSSLTLGANTYIPTAEGYYSLSTRGFSDPVDQIKIAGGKLNPKTGKVSTSVTRFWETEITVAGVVKRARAEMSIIILTDKGITATNLDVILNDLSVLLTPTNLNQILQGAQ
uniref:Uncharacterized protein n=1 Tax=Sanxia levi-like virus 1 TaxID=1923359 RepID=A0A1L3KIF6_9VIRU|nr:hypothetical protein [Sanxia levi-like virus 1]